MSDPDVDLPDERDPDDDDLVGVGDFDTEEYVSAFISGMAVALVADAEELYARDIRLTYEIYYTMNDPGVCMICEPFHAQIFRIGEGPEVPQHLACRCWKIYERI